MEAVAPWEAAEMDAQPSRRGCGVAGTHTAWGRGCAAGFEQRQVGVRATWARWCFGLDLVCCLMALLQSLWPYRSKLLLLPDVLAVAT